MRRIILISLCILMLVIVACGPSKKVSRISTDQTTDLSGRWNDTDAGLVAQEMVKDVLSRAWYPEFLDKNDKRKPVVIVGTIRNLSDEHIETGIFISDIERELINSGQVKFVASKIDREEVRDEKLDQQTNASEDTYKKLAEETGADYMLQGSIKTIIDKLDNNTAKFYQTDLQLIHLQSNEKVWIGTKKIKKMVVQNKYK